MPNSTRMGWAYPSENQRPWFDAFEDFVGAVDASGFAAREDRNAILSDGGTIGWSAGTSTLTWSSSIMILSAATRPALSISSSAVTPVLMVTSSAERTCLLERTGIMCDLRRTLASKLRRYRREYEEKAGAHSVEKQKKWDPSTELCAKTAKNRSALTTFVASPGQRSRRRTTNHYQHESSATIRTGECAGP